MKKVCMILLERQTGTSPCSALKPYSWILAFMPCVLGSYLEYIVCKPEKAMATHSWKLPQTEEPGRLQSMGSLRVGHH